MSGKSVIVLRHAKAQPVGTVPRDYDRVLNDKGRRQVRHLADLVRVARERVDAVIASSAPRALETATEIAEAMGPGTRLETDESFYGCLPERWLDALRDQPGEREAVMIVGHNPELEMVAEALGGTAVALPTCGLVKYGGLARWADIGKGPMRRERACKPAETMDGADAGDEAGLARIWEGTRDAG